MLSATMQRVLAQAAELARTQPIEHAQFPNLPRRAVNLNVIGRRAAEPSQGFGQLWHKTYRARLGATEPTQAARVWRERFGEFWTRGNHVYLTRGNLAPGEIGLLNLAMPGMALATGMIVVHADDTSFSFVTLQGHMYAGVILFSVFAENHTTFAQVEPLLRASDPLFELSMRLRVGHLIEDRFWHATLSALAAHFGGEGKVEQHNELLDARVQWGYAKNLWHNAAIRSGLFALTAPLRGLTGR